MNLQASLASNIQPQLFHKLHFTHESTKWMKSLASHLPLARWCFPHCSLSCTQTHGLWLASCPNGPPAIFWPEALFYWGQSVRRTCFLFAMKQQETWGEKKVIKFHVRMKYLLRRKKWKLSFPTLDGVWAHKSAKYSKCFIKESYILIWGQDASPSMKMFREKGQITFMTCYCKDCHQKSYSKSNRVLILLLI